MVVKTYGSSATTGMGKILEAVVKSTSSDLKIKPDLPVTLAGQLGEVVISIIESLAMDSWYRRLYGTVGFNDTDRYDEYILSNSNRRSDLLMQDSIVNIHSYSLRKLLIGTMFDRRRGVENSYDSEQAYSKVNYHLLAPVVDIRTFGVVELVTGGRGGTLATLEGSVEDFRRAMLHHSFDSIADLGQYGQSRVIWHWRSMLVAFVFFRAYSALVHIVRLAAYRPWWHGSMYAGPVAFDALDNTSRLVEAYVAINELERLGRDEYWPAITDTIHEIRMSRNINIHQFFEKRFYRKERIAGRIAGWLTRLCEGRQLGTRTDGS